MRQENWENNIKKEFVDIESKGEEVLQTGKFSTGNTVTVS